MKRRMRIESAFARARREAARSAELAGLAELGPKAAWLAAIAVLAELD